MRFQDRVAIITGSGSGLGRVLAHRFAAEGAAVVVADVVGQLASAVGDEISLAGGKSLAQTTDVTNAADVEAMVGAAREVFGPVDILVNNAAKATDADFTDMSEETWDDDVGVTLKGPFLCSQAVLAGMVQNESGVILNISSVNALAYFGNEAYSAAKAGILSLTRSLAVRYGPYGVRVNAIVPGTLRTPAWEQRQQKDPEVFERIAKWYPLGRIGEPEVVAGAALFLASDEASWITGAVLPVDCERKQNTCQSTHRNLDSHDLRHRSGARRGGSDQTHASTTASIIGERSRVRSKGILLSAAATLILLVFVAFPAAARKPEPQAGEFCAAELPLGSPSLQETRTTTEVAPGVTYTLIERGEQSGKDFYTVDVAFETDLAAAKAAAKE